MIGVQCNYMAIKYSVLRLLAYNLRSGNFLPSRNTNLRLWLAAFEENQEARNE